METARGEEDGQQRRDRADPQKTLGDEKEEKERGRGEALDLLLHIDEGSWCS